MARDAGLELLEHRNGRADLPRRAVAALVAVVLNERGLHRVQVAGSAQPFNRRDAAALLHDRKRQARIDAPSVRDHSARTALSLVAAFLCAGELEVLAKGIEQR